MATQDQATSDEELRDELSFLAAMQAYRNARESGDPAAIAAAEDAWREQVRSEILRNEGCQS